MLPIGIIKMVILDEVSSADDDDRAVDVDCVMSLGVAFHELQLIRVEQHLSAGRRSHSDVAGNDSMTPSNRRLLLGDVHTDPSQRVVYRPMGFQPALVPYQVCLFSSDHVTRPCGCLATSHVNHPHE